MKSRPKLSFWQIWNMNFGFLGIQFGFALQNANVSRIFETLGASIDSIPILWIAAPVTGLLVHPVIGYFSDKTWTRFGRRKPYFLIGAILASLALLIMPNSPYLWVAAGMLWILDATINVSMIPFRALVGDMLPSEQTTKGFAIQTFFIGVGSIVASFLPYLMTNYMGVSNTAPEGEIPMSVKLSFYLGAAAFFGAVLWTALSTKEYTPEQIAEYNEPGTEEKHHTGMTEFFQAFAKMPKTMIQLAFVQFFSWFALFAMWIYTTSAVTSHIYHTTDTTSAAYNEGADWVGVCFGLYNGFTAIFSFLLPFGAKYIGRKGVHAVSLIIGGISLASIFFVKSPDMLIIPFIGIGLAWASILTMPFSILINSLPPKQFGIYVGIFNIFVVIPQILAASILGFLTKNLFGGEAIYAIVLGGISMVISAVMVMFVKDSGK